MKQFPPITDLLPHTAPMVLVERILYLNNDSIGGETILNKMTPGNRRPIPSAPAASLPVAWSIEIIAQLCAAFISLTNAKGGFSKGRLLKVRQAHFRVDTLPLQEPLAITAHLESRSDQGVFIFSGSLATTRQSISRADLVILAQ